MLFGSILCEDERVLFELLVVIVILLVILLVVIVLGNILICWVIVKDLNKEFRLLFNYLVFNFVIVDFIIGVIMEFLFVVFYVREVLKFEVMNCVEIVYVLYFIICIVLVFSIVVLVIERYFIVIFIYRRMYL